jgi:hypothetical protein
VIFGERERGGITSPHPPLTSPPLTSPLTADHSVSQSRGNVPEKTMTRIYLPPRVLLEFRIFGLKVVVYDKLKWYAGQSYVDFCHIRIRKA